MQIIDRPIELKGWQGFQTLERGGDRKRWKGSDKILTLLRWSQSKAGNGQATQSRWAHCSEASRRNGRGRGWELLCESEASKIKERGRAW
jgi:hypothetical protein